jgi:hypothetical protein
VEDAGVGGFVPGPAPLAPAAGEVEFSKDFAEGEDAVVVCQVVGAHRFGLGDGAVVGVVEEEAEAAFVFAVLADALDEGVVVPFVNEDQVGAGEGVVEVERLEVVGEAGEVGVGVVEFMDGFFAVFFAEVFDAPGVAGLIDADVVAAREELADDSAKEVGVAVVPVGDEGVIEEDDAHGVKTPLMKQPRP